MILRFRFVLSGAAMAAALCISACNSSEGQGGVAGTTAATAGAAGSGAVGGAGSAGSNPTTSTTTGSGGSAGSLPVGCQTNADCALDPNGPVCDPSSATCVSCIPIDDPAVDCGMGSWCVPSKGQCEAGCTGDADCKQAGDDVICDLDLHICVGCISDDTCPAGSVCLNAQCLPGCNPTHNCPAGYTCCGEQCFELGVDENNCGSCNNSCKPVPHADVVCKNGQCQQGICNVNFADCNGDAEDGCETNTIVDGACTCAPGEEQSCYLGAPGTLGFGPCQAGSQLCRPDGLGWEPCMGQVLPQPEVCFNGVDENCDGVMDNATDMDLDGWTSCEGDCDDSNALVNPGAFEVTYTLNDHDNDPMTPALVVPGGNGVDDDCDPNTSDTVPAGTCGGGVAKLTGVTPNDVAMAIDLCQFTTANEPKLTRKWGVTSHAFKLASGADPGAQLSNMQNNQAAIMTQYGTLNGLPNNPPKFGPTMFGMSSGRMRYVGQASYVSPETGTSFNSNSACPASYLAAHAGDLPSSQGCSGNCFGGDTCNDSIEVKLEIRVPTNAKSMSYDFRFFSAEYPDFLCSTFNDFYLALLTSGAQGIPADKNVSFDGLGNAVSVNNGFFDVCQPAGCFTCLAGTSGLAGTGLDLPDTPSNLIGGGTSWLTTDAPVVPGETITLELMVFDVGDWSYDSIALIDNFRWGLNTTAVKTHQ